MAHSLYRKALPAALVLAFLPGAAFAQDAPALDSGNTAWMLVSTLLVLFMTIPGLSLFYAGLVRSKNVLSVMMQCFAITCLVTILWVVYGYSLAFGGEGKYLGGLDKLFLKGVGVGSIIDGQTIPETVFLMFQMTFAIITPALIVGTFAERMKFSALLWFMGLWFTLVYAPVAHWVWGTGGWLLEKGVLDFAGGTVVHINAGVAALVACVVIGKRMGYPSVPMPPNSLVLTVVGAAMLWVGWFGFNAGSALSAGTQAGMAMVVTHVATAAAALTWMFAEWMKHGKPSALGIVTGAVAGLVAITPASGYVGPVGSIAIGVASGVVCFWASTSLKRAMGYDDSLDVFGVHGVGGIVGAILTGIFASHTLGGSVNFAEAGSSIAGQLGKQFLGVIVTVIYSGVLTLIILKVIDAVIGLRVSEEQETEGLDIALHDERGFTL